MGGDLTESQVILTTDDGFSFTRFVLGMVAVQLAFMLLGFWYLVFSGILLVPFAGAVAALNVLGWDLSAALILVAFVFSPFALVFLCWMMIGFIGPVYIGILRRIKLVQFHRITVDDVLNLVREKRQKNMSDLLSFMRWLRVAKQ